jgi:PTS system galactosamine-specific IIC component
MHEVTLVQGILLFIMAVICGIDMWLEGIYIFRPIIVGTLTGAILGDVKTGVMAGGLAELAFAGLTAVGGTQPPNSVLAGVMTSAIAITTGKDPKLALALALPFSLLMQYVILFFYSSFSFFMGKLDKYAEDADTNGFARINWITMAIVGLTYGVVVFLCAYAAQGPMRSLVASMPGWLTNGFSIAGGILPAIGFAMLLRIMMKVEFIPYLIFGFVFVCFIPFGNVLPVAALGTAFALFEFFKQKNAAQVQAHAPANVNDEEDYSDGI